MSDDVLAGQIAYYRARATEYDETAYGDVASARERIARLVAELRPSGRVLEIACGTGMWTAALASTAASVRAIDAAPEAVALARQRVTAGNTQFEVADVFAWSAPETYDLIFFSAWLSHVPADRFADFWRRVGEWLAEGGRVVFVDEHVDERDKEAWAPDGPDVVERRLGDGRVFRVVKRFVDPGELTTRLAALGWAAGVRRDGRDWVVGEARPLG